MKENKNIDKFFAERLSDPDIPVEAWNTPPAGLWKSAQVQFPVIKSGWTISTKIILGISSLAIVAVGYLCITQINNNINHHTEITPIENTNRIINESSTKTNTSSEEITISSLVSVKSNPISTEKENNINIDQQNISNQKNNLTSNNTNTSISNSGNSVVEFKPEKEIKNKQQTIYNYTSTTEKTNEVLEKNSIIETSATIPQTKIPPLVNTANTGGMSKKKRDVTTNEKPVSINNENKELPNSVDRFIATPEVKIVDEKKSATTTIIAELPILNSDGYATIERLESIDDTPRANSKTPLAVPIIIPIRKYYPKHEVGLTRLHTVFDLLGEISVGSPGDTERLDLNTHYFNINRSYARWLNPKWSISTGFNISDLNVDLDFNVLEVITDSDIDNFVTREYNDITGRSNVYAKSSEVNGFSSEEINISLFPGVSVAEGETIQIQGILNAGVNAIQIPFYINRHWYARRVEFYTGVGVSLDYFNINQASATINILRDGENIAEPYRLLANQNSKVDYSLYIQGGIKIPITDFLNISLATRTNILDPYLTGIETGVYYRWNNY